MKARDMFKNYEKYRLMSEELGKYVREEFEDTKQYEKFVKSIDISGGQMFDFGNKPEVLEFD